MSRETRLAEIKEDRDEYNRLLEIAQRPKVKQILTKQISALTTEETKINKEIESEKLKAESQKQQQQTKQQTQPKPPTSNVIYTPLTKYSWEDESKKAKIYFSLQNIGKQVPANQIDIQFKPHSVQLKIRNYRKQNLIFSIKRTYSQIIPQQCAYLVKSNHLAITLTKASSGTWTQLHFKEEKFGLGDKGDTKDPNASIMNMMKKMYEEGDENMKRTMAEAWSKSKDGKGGQDAGFKFD